MRTGKLAAACILAFVVQFQNARAQSPSSGPAQFVMTDKLAYMPLPPELIASPVVRAVTYSADGRYALIQREHIHLTQAMVDNLVETKRPPEGEQSLILWDSDERSSTVVWHGSTTGNSVQQVEWMHGSDAALVMLQRTDPPDPANPMASRRTHQVLLRISGTSGSAVEIGATRDVSIGTLSLSVSPSLPIAVVEELRPVKTPPVAPGQPAGVGYETIMYLVDSHSRATIPIDFHTDDVFPSAQWDAAGNPLITVFHRPPGVVKPTQIWFSIDPRTGKSTQLAQAPVPYAPHNQPLPARDIQVRTTTVTAHEGDTNRAVSLLWLESATKSESPRALISGDIQEGILLPHSDMILYRSQQAFWAVPLLKMKSEVALNAIHAAQRVAVMNKAKQVGLALIMCAQDNDDNLPGQNGLNSILPYLGPGGAGFLDGFNYTYAGGSMAEIDNPSQTVLGSMDGPGGRAILYADGHVKWQ